MNNKQLGTEFEREMLAKFSEHGWWAHFISPDNRGAQPFDIIAVKDGIAVAGDCKTCKLKSFTLRRLEQNQIMAFLKWEKCGNKYSFIFVKHKDEIRLIPFREIYERGKVSINDFPSWEQSGL